MPTMVRVVPLQLFLLLLLMPLVLLLVLLLSLLPLPQPSLSLLPLWQSKDLLSTIRMVVIVVKLVGISYDGRMVVA